MIPAGTLQDGVVIPQIAPPYSQEQIRTYLAKIGWQHGSSEPESFDVSLENLRRLVFLHTLAFPQDISALHYTAEHHMPVTPQGAYQSMVVENRGSYCFGQNGLMLGMLRGLGYRAVPVAGRVLGPSPSGPAAPWEYSGFHHLVLLVQPYAASSQYAAVAYVVDVGFGGTGPMRPILLADGEAGGPQQTPDEAGDAATGGWIWGTYPPERHRVVRGTYHGGCLEIGALAARSWHLQVSHASTFSPHELGVSEWKTLYTFTEVESFQSDIDAASYAVSGLTRYPFAAAVLCTRRVETRLQQVEDETEVARRGGGEGLRWVEKWSIEGAKLTHRVGPRTVEERKMRTERERVQALIDVFGIGMRLEDEMWIKGRVTALAE